MSEVRFADIDHTGIVVQVPETVGGAVSLSVLSEPGGTVVT